MMTLGLQRAKTYLTQLIAEHGVEALAQRLAAKTGPAPRHVPGRNDTSIEAVQSRWDLLDADDRQRGEILDEWTLKRLDRYSRNIEHLIGTAKVPIGLAGPLRVNGLFAQGDYYGPLATTEASLVASYSRGAALITKAGGASVALLGEGVSRAPVLVFDDLPTLGRFLNWAFGHTEEIEQAANGTTRFGHLEDVQISVMGTSVYFQFIFSTGDAAGQNMVTIATEAALTWILAHTPVKPRSAFLESNYSGDKKASARGFQTIRGKKVVAQAVLPGALIERYLHTTASRMAEYIHLATIGSVMSGALGAQGHYANGLTALFLACGQDVACVSEASVGITDCELTVDGGLKLSVTLPNLIVGTVGGGTGLPSQQAALALMGLAGAGKARAFAEVVTAFCLAGEVSLIGAIAAGEFAAAHARLARGKEIGPSR